MERLSLKDTLKVCSILRVCADTLEDKNQLANFEGLRRRPDLDQDMLLTLNNAINKKSDYKKSLPDAGTIVDKLKERVVKVSTSNKQSAILGLFYTILYPLSRYQKIAAGIFPIHPDKVEYILLPEINLNGLAGYGDLSLRQESASEENPFLIHNSKFPSFLFFRESPFNANHSSKLTQLEEDQYWRDDTVLPNKMSLEENLIKIILKNNNPFLTRKLFKQSGFRRFINSHCSDPKYMKLHTAYTQTRHRL